MQTAGALPRSGAAWIQIVVEVPATFRQTCDGLQQSDVPRAPHTTQAAAAVFFVAVMPRAATTAVVGVLLLLLFRLLQPSL